MGHRRLAYSRLRRIHRHAQTVFRVTGYITLQASLVFSEVAPHQRIIATVGSLVEKLQAQLGLGVRGLGNDQQSASVLVNTMYQSHFRVVRVKRRHIAQMPCNGIYQRAVKISRPGMHHQSGGFVYHHQFRVLVDDIERNIFRLDGIVMTWTVQHQRDDIIRTHLVVALYRTIIHMHESCVGSFLYAVTAGVLQLLKHKLIHAQRQLSLVYDKTKMFIELLLFVFQFFYFFNIFSH